MKIDQDYLKSLLEAFEASPNPVTDIRELGERGFDHEDKRFVFHMDLLHDQQLIARDDGRPGFGCVRGAGDSLGWSVVSLRLTADGHEFLEAIRNKEIWGVIKTSFKEASIGTMWRVAKELGESYAKKKLQGLLEDGA